jgi:DNA repair exonuclease SbcCD nuclease subunit
MAVLDAAGVIRLMAEPGPALVLDTDQGDVLVGASPDGSPLPSAFHKAGNEAVVWLAHHNLSFPDFPDKAVRIKDIPDVDWVINGHIHRPQMTQQAGGTRYANPGNITRLTFSLASKNRRPAAAAWTPGCFDLDRWVVPHLDFTEVFPDQELPPSMEESAETESLFLQGLERLAWRRTSEGWGLRQFLQSNLNPELEETRLVWELYEEVVSGGPEQIDD